MTLSFLQCHKCFTGLQGPAGPESLRKETKLVKGDPCEFWEQIQVFGHLKALGIETEMSVVRAGLARCSHSLR